MLFLSTGDLPPLLKPLLLNAKRGVREREGSLITALLWLHNSIALARVKSLITCAENQNKCQQTGFWRQCLPHWRTYFNERSWGACPRVFLLFWVVYFFFCVYVYYYWSHKTIQDTSHWLNGIFKSYELYFWATFIRSHQFSGKLSYRQLFFR